MNLLKKQLRIRKATLTFDGSLYVNEILLMFLFFLNSLHRKLHNGAKCQNTELQSIPDFFFHRKEVPKRR